MTRTDRLIHFLSEHDESWVFFFAYLVASILLSMYFNLGFFLILVLVHLFLDFLKHWHSSNRKTNRMLYAAYYSIRDGFLFDLFLFLVAFSIGYMLEATIAIGLSRGVKIATSLRVQTILRALPRIFIADWILENIVQVTIYLHEHDKKKTFLPVRMKLFERFLLVGITAMVVLIAFLPFVMGDTINGLFDYMRVELIPSYQLIP
ncbi:hypothetical protein ACFL2D_00605 [Patescibacteria group bacterium]